jgi:hypothetical protein
VYREGQLESFTHFTLLVATTVVGELHPQDEQADYFWADNPDFTSEDMLPNMKLLSQRCLEDKPFFIEETFNL